MLLVCVRAEGVCCVIRELGVTNEQEMRWVSGVPGKLGAKGTLQHRNLSEHCPQQPEAQSSSLSCLLSAV